MRFGFAKCSDFFGRPGLRRDGKSGVSPLIQFSKSARCNLTAEPIRTTRIGGMGFRPATACLHQLLLIPVSCAASAIVTRCFSIPLPFFCMAVGRTRRAFFCFFEKKRAARLHMGTLRYVALEQRRITWVAAGGQASDSLPAYPIELAKAGRITGMRHREKSRGRENCGNGCGINAPRGGQSNKQRSMLFRVTQRGRRLPWQQRWRGFSRLRKST